LEASLDFPFQGKYFDGVPATPVLFFDGDADQTSLQMSHTQYGDAKQPKYFVTIAGGGHSDPYRSGPPDYHMVADVTLAFLDHYLKRRGSDAAVTAAVAKYPFAKLEDYT